MSTSSSWIRAFSNAVWTAVTLNISKRLEDNSVLARRIEPENGIRRNVCVRTVKFARKTKTDEWRPSRGTCEIFSLFINGRYLRRPRSCVGHNCPSDTEYWEASGENRRVLDKGRRPRRTMDGRRRHRGRNSRARVARDRRPFRRCERVWPARPTCVCACVCAVLREIATVTHWRGTMCQRRRRRGERLRRRRRSVGVCGLDSVHVVLWSSSLSEWDRGKGGEGVVFRRVREPYKVQRYLPIILCYDMGWVRAVIKNIFKKHADAIPGSGYKIYRRWSVEQYTREKKLKNCIWNKPQDASEFIIVFAVVLRALHVDYGKTNNVACVSLI